jgi:hypothetical protein
MRGFMENPDAQSAVAVASQLCRAHSKKSLMGSEVIGSPQRVKKKTSKQMKVVLNFCF